MGGCAAGAAQQRTIIVMFSVPWSTVFFYCRSCRKFVRIFVQLCVPLGGTVLARVGKLMEKNSAVWNIYACFTGKMSAETLQKLRRKIDFGQGE